MDAGLTPAVPAQQRYFAPLAYLPGGWARDVTVSVDAQGAFAQVEAGTAGEGAVHLQGVMLPGMVNAHSHAFQRAMVGLSQLAGTGQDNFWSWRTLMYDLALRLSPEQVGTIATWVYTEMLRGGYTHVCEFHYLHNDRDGQPYADPAELSRAIVHAAQRTGIGLTLLPVLYMAGGFGGQPARAEQRRTERGELGRLARRVGVGSNVRHGSLECPIHHPGSLARKRNGIKRLFQCD